MEIKEIQKKAIEAIETRLNKKNIKQDVNPTLTHLIEEFGEIAQEINNVKLKRKNIDVNNLGKEISDCIILLLNLAKQYDIDIESTILNKIEEVKTNR